MSRVLYGGGGGGGGGNFPSQPQYSLPRNLEIGYDYYISYVHVTDHKYVTKMFGNFVPDRMRSNLRGI